MAADVAHHAEDAAREHRAQAVAPVLVAAFRRAGLPPVWGVALARQESDFRPQAVNHSAADARRGYSWGLCQMSLQTAQESLGYRGDGPGLTDPNINATLAATFVRRLVDGHHLQLDADDTLAQVASLYNSGRLLEHAPSSTAGVYVPNVVRYAAKYATLAASVPAPPARDTIPRTPPPKGTP